MNPTPVRSISTPKSVPCLNAHFVTQIDNTNRAKRLSKAAKNRTRPQNSTQAETPKPTAWRTNEQWLGDLRGLNGPSCQQLAHHDLTSYLYVVVLNYLQWKYAKSTAFADIAERDLATFVGDFIQDFMVKLMKEDYALLDKYSGRGRFTSWAAQVAHNLVGGEMRKAYWRRETETAPVDMVQLLTDEAESPEALAIRNAVGSLLIKCLDKLPAHYRTIIERCILLEESAIDIAQEENVTPNSIYIRLHRAKERLREIASVEGIELNINSGSA